jgi:hypothetical protein
MPKLPFTGATAARKLFCFGSSCPASRMLPGVKIWVISRRTICPGRAASI